MAGLFDEPQNTPKAQLPVQNNTEWQGLSPLKIAMFSACDSDGQPYVRKGEDGKGTIDDTVVRAILTDGEFSLESQYISPFENSNPENKMPTLLGMLQAGEAAQAFAQVSDNAATRTDSGVIGTVANAAIQGAGALGNIGAKALGYNTVGELFEAVKGRSSLTKVNSTQIFVSTSSAEMSLTLFFMALKDAKKEVEDQIRQLEEWVVPEELYDQSLLVSVNENRNLLGLFPSIVPPHIAFTYGGKTYKPFLIRSVSSPIVAPMDKDGNRLSISVTIAICSRRAMDRRDIQAIYRG